MRIKYQTPSERLEKAKTDGQSLLSSLEPVRNRPFIFRAPEPLKSIKKGFQFNPVTEHERVADNLHKNELFETDQFDRFTLLKDDLHRISEKKRWISPKGFNVVTRKQDFSVPNSSRYSLIKDGFKTIT